jgi:hypothetical protein
MRYVYLPLVLGVGLVEVEAVAEQHPRGDCDLGPADRDQTKKFAAFVRGSKRMQGAARKSLACCRLI